MDEIKSMLGHTVENSSAALRSSEESYNEAASGQKVIDDLRVAMLDIDRAYGELEEVNRVVSMIRNKTNVINDIVFKTQLLSFNASIEAARAGQHGRGFSVVAAEVGKLAEVSGVAAQEIGKLLDQSTRKVAQIVESTKYKVDSANQMSLKCASVFESITHRTGEARTMVDSITSAAAEQEAGIQQVSRAMTEMKDSSNQTDTMAHSIQKLSEALQDQSKSLAATIQSWDVLVNGEVGFNDIKTVVQSSSQSVRSMKRDSRRNSA
jgi:methyl-accepting chemotaxis protein